MDINNFIKREMERYGEGAKVESIPDGLRPTPESLEKLQRSIIEAADANDEMLQRSMVLAYGNYSR